MKKIFSLSILVLFLLSACGAGELSTATGNLEAWVDQPAPGSILPLGAFTVKGHARHISGSGVTKIEFLVNNIPIGSVDTDSGAPIVYAETSWNASTPGQYSLVARAYAGSESSDSLPVLVCVSDQVQAATISSAGLCDVPSQENLPAIDATADGSPTIEITSTAVAGSATVPASLISPSSVSATPIPSATTAPAADTSPPVVDITYVNPSDTLYYGAGCVGGILTVEAYVADADSGVGPVYLVYGYLGVGIEGIFVEMSPIGGNNYSATVNINEQAYNFLQGANGQIGIAVIGNDLAGNSAQDTGSNISLLFCPG